MSTNGHDNSIADSKICVAGVDLNGLMQVLSKHLYSTPMVALRELVQNSHDALVRRRLEQPIWQQAGRITVIGNRQAKQLHIIDTGAGLTEYEIHSFLATVGIGYTRSLRQQDDETGLIGMFGLGFLSAFVLAKQVTLITTSYQEPTKSWCYRSSNAEQYTVTAVEPTNSVGTEIILELKDEFSFLSSQESLKQVLGRYCALLHEPIYISDATQPINTEPPPWRKTANEVALHPVQERRKRLSFAARFEQNFEPICTFPVEPIGQTDALGMLWVQDGATYGTSDNRNLSVFLRGMLLDDDARDLLPSWAGFIGGVIESNRLVPTASREDLQRDNNYHAMQYALSEALINGLAEVATTQPEVWRRILKRHNEALLGASLCDDRLFELLMATIRVPTSQGDLTVEELRTNNAIHVMLGTSGGFEDTLFRALQVPVALGDRYAVVPFLRRYAASTGCQLIELGTEKGNQHLFTLAGLATAEKDWLTEQLADGEALIAARFAPAELPLVVVADREAELKKRLEEDEADKKISQAALRLARQFTAKISATQTAKLYINLNNQAVIELLAAFQAGNTNTEQAVRLLKSLKIIMAGRDLHKHRLDLNQALLDFTQSIQTLLAHT